MNPNEYPANYRLLVVFTIREEVETPATYTMSSGAIGTKFYGASKFFTWNESDQLAEITIVEWSPSGERVKIDGGDGRNYLGGITGWYDRDRIRVKEVLPRKKRASK